MNFFVEGPLRDPGNPNKPSTPPIGEANMVGTIPGLDVHWGLAVAVVLAIAVWVLMNRTKFGFAARITGGNVRAARAQGLPVGKLIVVSCALAGACAGLAGYFEVAAIQGRAKPRSPPATVSPAFSSHSSPARTRSPSSPSRSSSAASTPPAASSSAGWECPTPPCRCCRD